MYESLDFSPYGSWRRFQVHVHEYLGIHMWRIRENHQGLGLVWAVSSNRKNCTLALQRPHSALYSAEGTHAPPAHLACRNCGETDKWGQTDTESRNHSEFFFAI